MKRLAFAGDLHKRARDITTIEGYVQCNVEVQKALMQMFIELCIDKFFGLGDWYDKGYVNDVAASLADCDLDIQMANQLNGEFYGLIGNHIRLSMDSNPELHLIQPHPELKSRRPVIRNRQIIRTPDVLRVNDVQISFMHHKPNVEDCRVYKPLRQPWAKYHIALFHTPLIVPNERLIHTNYGYNASSNSKIAETLEGVDLAIVGDIHKPLGQFPINTASGVTTMVVPGSLTNTDSGMDSRHTSINIPIVTIDDDSSVTLEYYPFDLKTNLVTFKQKVEKDKKNKLKSLRGNATKQLYESEDDTARITHREEALMSLNAFMRDQGYSDKDKRMMQHIIQNPNDLEALIMEYIQ